MKTKLFLTFLCIVNFTFSQTFVNVNATGANNGMSWTDAYISLQDALVNANPGDEIWVAEGVYRPHTSNRATYFNINDSDLKIYGGFSGTEIQITDRVFGANETILSGDLQANDVNTNDFASNYSNTTRNTDNSYHIINILSTGNNLLLDGFTISDAHNNLSGTERGGAIIKAATVSNLTIKNCIIKDNVSRNDNAGLLAEFNMNNANTGASGTLIVENSKFINNMSRWGSGIYSFVRENSNVDITVVNCLFDNNIAGDLSNTLLGLGGSASWFRGVELNSELNLDLVNNTYVNNRDLGTHNNLTNASRSTVAISKDVMTSLIVFNANVSNCLFWNNRTYNDNITRSISDLYLRPANTNIYNSIDELDFNDFSITSKTNTIYKYPQFTDAMNQDYTLLPNSPAVGMGDNSKIPTGIIKDLSNNDRIQQINVDIGAFESVNAPLFEETVLFVDANATGANNGTSWGDAYNDLQDAIANLESGSDIWVASGTYNPHVSNRTVYYEINKAHINIYGGFSGGEAEIDDRVFGVNETILSGDLQGNDVNTNDFASNYSNTTRSTDNSYHIINIGQSGINLKLDGLTISDAHTNINSAEIGGAIIKHMNIPRLIMHNCVIKNNVSRNGNAGLFAEFSLSNTNNGPNGELIIENSKFINNMSRYGSAIYSYLNSNTTVDISIVNTLFENNIAADLSSSVKGMSGSASWFRTLQANTVLNINLTNNTYAKNIDTGTDQSLTNALRGVVVISKPTLSTGSVFSNVSNCIFWDNETAGGVTSRALSYQNEIQPDLLDIFNSIDELDFNYGMVTNTNNTTNANPLFMGATNGDFTLQSGSPAIDSGDNTKIPSGVTTDLALNYRIHNTTVDMGAYEFGATSTLSIETIDEALSLSIYPNPVKEIIYINSKEEIQKVKAYTIHGKEVPVTISNHALRVSHLASGIYILRIKTSKGTGVQRFIKQ